MRTGTRIGRPLRALLLVAIGAAGGGVAWAVASVPDGNGVIHACVNVTGTNGTTTPVTTPGIAYLRIIDTAAGQTCNTTTSPGGPTTPAETNLTWNVTGPTGPAGPPGPPGATGATGVSSNPTLTVTLAPPNISNSPDGLVTLDALKFGLLSFSYVTGAGQTGSAATKSKISEIRIVKLTDKTTPKLALATATGQHFHSAIIVVAKPAGAKAQKKLHTFMTITLSDVIVSSFAVGGQTRSTDTLTLSFGKISIKAK